MASGGPAPLARMYREQLCRRARSVGTVGLLPGLNTLSFETEEYRLFRARLRTPSVYELDPEKFGVRLMIVHIQCVGGTWGSFVYCLAVGALSYFPRGSLSGAFRPPGKADT